MKRIGIIGSGDLGKLIAHHAPFCGNFEVVCFFDDFVKLGSLVAGVSVEGGLKDIHSAFEQGKFDELMVGIGYNHMDFRKSIFEQFRGLIPFSVLIHHSAFVDPSVEIGQGSFILPGCTLDHNAAIGENVLLNTAVTIAHDTKIGNHSFLAPAAALAGKTEIGECCILGLNCTIIDNLRIGNFIRIAAGAVVLNSFEVPGMYAGIPAELKKKFNQYDSI
jgi:sugar O-acyltransferase (sialic acid O-acetyltransferase NeuD family)